MCPIVSANWNNGSNAGVWALNLNNVRGNANNNVGGRADSGSASQPARDGWLQGRRVLAAWRQAAKSVAWRVSGRAGAERGFDGQTP